MIAGAYEDHLVNEFHRCPRCRWAEVANDAGDLCETCESIEALMGDGGVSEA